jgi:hypothetical protein
MAWCRYTGIAPANDAMDPAVRFLKHNCKVVHGRLSKGYVDFVLEVAFLFVVRPLHFSLARRSVWSLIGRPPDSGVDGRVLYFISLYPENLMNILTLPSKSSGIRGWKR